MKRRYGIVDSRPFRDPNLSQGTQSHLPELLCTRKERLHILYSFDGGLPLKLLEWYCFWFTLLERRIFIKVLSQCSHFRNQGAHVEIKFLPQTRWPSWSTHTESGSEPRIILGPDTTALTGHNGGYWKSRGKWIFGQAHLSMGPVRTHIMVIFSVGVVKLSCPANWLD